MYKIDKFFTMIRVKDMIDHHVEVRILFFFLFVIAAAACSRRMFCFNFIFVASVYELKNLEIADDEKQVEKSRDSSYSRDVEQRCVDKATAEKSLHRRNNAPQSIMTSTTYNQTQSRHKNNAQTLNTVPSTYTTTASTTTTTTTTAKTTKTTKTNIARSNFEGTVLTIPFLFYFIY